MCIVHACFYHFRHLLFALTLLVIVNCIPISNSIHHQSTYRGGLRSQNNNKSMLPIAQTEQTEQVEQTEQIAQIEETKITIAHTP